MSPEQVQQHFEAESVSELARKLGKPVSTVHEWFQRGVVPRAVQLELEIDTAGALKADRVDPGRAAA